jgi:hydroxymethylglutaryl-CoA reductase (NADPH)
MNNASSGSTTAVPTRWVGPIAFKRLHYTNKVVEGFEISAPLATYETTLFASVSRGLKAIRLANTLETSVLSDRMTRSILLEAESVHDAHQTLLKIQSGLARYQREVVEALSQHTRLEKLDAQQVANLLYLRFSFHTGNASGHNMSTFAADRIAEEILKEHPTLKYVSVSANYCIDKKTSSVNAILGRGKHTIASVRLSRSVCASILKTTPERILDLNLKKNMIGSILAGSAQSANAHYANMLLAFYIATGQDGANVVEGSQGITHAYLDQDELVFSVNLPNIIVGTIGHGKHQPDASQALKRMGCEGEDSAQTLAQIAAALVLAGELSLMSALTNRNELTRSHQTLERKAQP